ncbi:MAG: DNA-3-methyladenine glycosylase family protein [Bacillota bacterium]
MGLSRQKLCYLRDLAERFATGQIPIRRFPSMTDEQIIQSLLPIKGVGRWTAEMFLIFVLNRPDLLPVDDLGVRKGIQTAYALKSLPDAPAMTQIAEPWRPWRTIATWYLWRYAAIPSNGEKA